MLPRPPEDVQTFCNVIVWRNVPSISHVHISSYDVKLYNPDTGREVIRRTQGYETLYIVTDADEGFRQDMATVQVSPAMDFVCSCTQLCTIKFLMCMRHDIIIGIVHAQLQCQVFASNNSSKVIYLFSGININ